MVYIKWTGAFLLIFATIIMVSPTIAATSYIPWFMLFASNTVWLVDAFNRKDYPWIFISTFLGCWDLIIIVQRVYNTDEFTSHIIKFIERLI